MRTPELSLYLTTYTDGPHHDWRATLQYAHAMDTAGVDRVVVSDHVVFGEVSVKPERAVEDLSSLVEAFRAVTR